MSKPKLASKKIEEYTDDELEYALEIASHECHMNGFNFWIVLRGVHAYMEKRKRKMNG